MTTNQLFFAMAGLMITLLGLAMGFFKYYLDARIDGLDAKLSGSIDGIDARLDALVKSVDMLIQYMISHEGRIASLEERTKKL